MTESVEQAIQPYINAVTAKKAIDVMALDVRKQTSYTDIIIIAGGQSGRQVTAIGEFVRRELRKQGIKPLGVEGLKEGQWVLMDYGHVIIHLFHEDIRKFYDLEGLWSDARRLKIGRP